MERAGAGDRSGRAFRRQGRRPGVGLAVVDPVEPVTAEPAADTCELTYGGSPETDRASLLRAAEVLADLLLLDLERFPPDRGESSG